MKILVPFSNMMLLSLSLFMMIGCVQASLPAIPGKYVTSINFNHGVSDATKTCSDAEWNTVRSAIWNAAQGRRGLRRQGDFNDESRPPRQLSNRLRCALCGDFCEFVGCPKLANRRRELQTVDNTHCDAQHGRINAALLQLQSQTTLSLSCRALVAAPRTMACHVAAACGIDHVSLWNVTTNAVQINDFPVTNGTICTSSNVTFTAETNYEPQNVRFNLTGTSTYKLVNTEYGAPFFLHPRRNGIATGVKFPVGNYTLRIRGDEGTQSKTVQFAVLQ